MDRCTVLMGQESSLYVAGSFSQHLGSGAAVIRAEVGSRKLKATECALLD